MFATLTCPPLFALPDSGHRAAFSRMRVSDADDSGEERAAQDAVLLRRIGGGDRDALAALYDRFSRPLYSTALRILRDESEAQDIVQDTFVALWEKAAAFDAARGSAFAWAVTFARNRAIDRVRQRTRRAELLAAAAPHDIVGADESAGTDSAGELQSKDHAASIRAAVASLPLEQKHAVELAFFSGLTQQEIAEKLSTPLGTVKARIRRGLLKLRDTLARRHD